MADENLNSPTLSADTNAKRQLSDYSERVADILGSSLVGFHVHLAFAHKCFCPKTIDLDMIVMLNGPFRIKLFSNFSRYKPRKP